MAVFPVDEAARIAALNRYAILDTPPEQKFDRITGMVSDICEAPIALISLIDSERQWFKSHLGMDATETPRDIAFCDHTIREDDLFIVPDASADDRFRDNPLVMGPPYIRTYIGAVLMTKDGYRVGTLCAMYPEVTPISDTWKEHLTTLAAIVIDELELRVALSDAEIAVSVAEESEARFRDVAAASGEWIWETDADHRFTYISENSTNPVFSQSQLIGLRRWELPLFNDDYSQFDAHREVLERHEPFRRYEYSYIDGNDRRQYRQISGNPVFDRDGNLKGYRGTTTDVTEQVETIQDLRAARTAAEQANIAKSEFLANMSHELRTPLNAIIGFSDLMLNATPSAFLKPVYFEYTNDIRQSGQDLLKIVNDILDLSKVEAGRPELHAASVNIPAIVRAIVQRLSIQAEESNLTVSSRFSDDLPPLLADELKLKQILINLLANAIKFTPSGGMITISADFSADAGHLIKVSDTGIGIAPEDIDKVLAPFVQVDSSLSRKYNGTGLGLPLAASFVEMHGGSLKIVSDAGAGTTVEIRFPPGKAGLTGHQPNDVALTPEQAMELISEQEHASSCVITNPRLPDNPIVYVTPEFEKQTGYTLTEVLGRNGRFLQGPMTAPESVAAIRDAIREMAPVQIDIINYRKDGSQFRNQVSIRPTRDTKGEATLFVATQSTIDDTPPGTPA